MSKRLFLPLSSDFFHVQERIFGNKHVLDIALAPDLDNSIHPRTFDYHNHGFTVRIRSPVCKKEYSFDFQLQPYWLFEFDSKPVSDMLAEHDGHLDQGYTHGQIGAAVLLRHLFDREDLCLSFWPKRQTLTLCGNAGARHRLELTREVTEGLLRMTRPSLAGERIYRAQ